MNQRRGFLAGIAAIGKTLGLMSSPTAPGYGWGENPNSPRVRSRKQSRYFPGHVATIDNPRTVIPAGCQEFNINGVKIVALSQKRAQAKYDKLKG